MAWSLKFVLIVPLLGGHGCGGDSAPAWQCAAEQAGFSRAAVSVDLGKRMPDLTADERTAACAEFTRALNASLGSPTFICKGLTNSAAGTAACQASYADCLQAPPASGYIYCTEKMSGMWNCPITIGQYQDCFNDLNGMLFALVEKNPACTTFDLNACGTQATPPSCAAADCDYTWTD